MRANVCYHFAAHRFVEALSMANISFRISAFVILFLLQAGKVSAFSCEFPEALVLLNDPTLNENGAMPSEKELLRFRSIVLAESFQARDGAVVVYGQFFKNEDSPFLHEKLLENIRSLYSRPSENTQLPVQIEYTYFNAYRFSGHQILNGELVPFVDDGVHVRISIFDAHEGMVDALPPTARDVFGMLRPSSKGKGMEVIASTCPTYLTIEPDQLADLLVCKRDGACR